MQKIKERLFGAVVFLALSVIFVPMFFSENNKKINLTDTQMKEPVVNTALAPISEPENLVVLNQLEKPSFDVAVQPYQDIEDLAVHESISPNADTSIQNTLELLEANPKQVVQLIVAETESTPHPAMLTSDAMPAVATTAVNDAAQSDSKNPTTLPEGAQTKPQQVLTKAKKGSITTKADSITSSRKSRVAEGAAAWVVQLATFKEGANADSLVKKLQKDGYPAYSRPMQNTQGTYTLVLVGPKVGRAEADSLKVDLKTKYRLQGVVIQHQPISS